MNIAALSQKPPSLFTAMGGWHTLAEVIASRALFLIAYLLTDRVLTSALVAVVGVLVFAVIRVFTRRQYWQAAGGLAVVAVSTALAGSTGHGVDFYVLGVVVNVVAATVFGASMLLRWPLIGLVVTAARRERAGWRRNHVQRRRYNLCTAVFFAKFCFATAVMVPLYLTGQVVALGIADTLLTIPGIGVCGYVSWRILRWPDDRFESAVPR